MDNLIKMPVTVFIDAVDVYICVKMNIRQDTVLVAVTKNQKQQLKQGKSMFLCRTQRRGKQFRTDAVV